ncbi:MAG: hypothetical protein GY679_05420, partial [Mycoplasma sp.]|nr:hypothetical protein [Mycoplasma sp.]
MGQKIEKDDLPRMRRSFERIPIVGSKPKKTRHYSECELNETGFGDRIQHQMIFHGQTEVEQEPVGDTTEDYVPQVPEEDHVPQEPATPPIRRSKRGNIPKKFGPEFIIGDEMDQGIDEDEVHFALSAAVSPEPKTFEEA